jgi:glycosyltransferase involved in cell wall biosynthesis
VVVNEAGRRGRVTGTDLLAHFAVAAPLDLFGIDAAGAPAPVCAIEDLPQDALHTEIARRRAYLHPIRWTSLGLSLLEAMHLGMPVVALGTTEVHEAVPPEAGLVSTRLDVLTGALRRLIADPGEAAARGAAARSAALRRYGLGRFHTDWDAALHEWVGRPTGVMST